MGVREFIYKMLGAMDYNDIARLIIDKFGININTLNEIKSFPNISRAMAMECFYIYRSLDNNKRSIIIDYSRNDQIFADTFGECINLHGDINDFYEIISKNKCIRNKIDNIKFIYYNKNQ